MNKARELKESQEIKKINKQREIELRNKTTSEQFQTRLARIESQGLQKESEIANLEKVEAELLNKIKTTQNVQMKYFKELEEAMYQQQYSAK